MSHEISIETRGAGGWILLNRHGALNALTYSMLETIHRALDQFEQNDQIHFVVVDSLNSKAFCAGGDIRAAYDHRYDLSYAKDYFATEYGLNGRIASYPKPYISLIDGLCLGGGMGLSCHGTYRIMSDRAQMAMPETAIGFFPDVGAGYFLNRCPGFLGRYLGLTGARAHLDDALFLKLATHGIEQQHFEPLRIFLSQLRGSHTTHQLDEWLIVHAKSIAVGPIENHADLLNVIFSQALIEDIAMALTPHKGDLFIKCTLDQLKRGSPTSLKVTLAYLDKCRGLSLDEVLQLDTHLAFAHCLKEEFYEGIRAMVVDKDKSPAWNPSTLSEVTDAHVKSYFP